MSTFPSLKTVLLTVAREGFTWRSNGQNYDARFNCKTYPQTIDSTHTMVTVDGKTLNGVCEFS